MLKEIEMLVQGYEAFRDSYFNGDNGLYEKLVAEGIRTKSPARRMIGSWPSAAKRQQPSSMTL